VLAAAADGRPVPQAALPRADIGDRSSTPDADVAPQ